MCENCDRLQEELDEALEELYTLKEQMEDTAATPKSPSLDAEGIARVAGHLVDLCNQAGIRVATRYEHERRMEDLRYGRRDFNIYMDSNWDQNKFALIQP